MPFYEYRCLKCDHKTVVLRKMDDRHKSCACEECGGETEFCISAGFFKVPPWHETLAKRYRGSVPDEIKARHSR